eukprot:TRINITY_DN7709_c0_g1_i1.p1 TRINITY_DN7709_c0_g1~~TRINITY_DN7709_c0_g1_i1.p1  ORF type:complete len:449 (+),score=65.32 TRINITY_DN7709_c0_g1_i1:301-1647(+)
MASPLTTFPGTVQSNMWKWDRLSSSTFLSRAIPGPCHSRERTERLARRFSITAANQTHEHQPRQSYQSGLSLSTVPDTSTTWQATNSASAAGLSLIAAAVIALSCTQPLAASAESFSGPTCQVLPGDSSLVAMPSMADSNSSGNSIHDGTRGGDINSSTIGTRSELVMMAVGAPALPFEPPPVMMEGMSMKNFDVRRYVGRWYEVLSIKRGFAGQGQEDCHCTQGVYSFNEAARTIDVDTFCVHGSPDGYITGIRGRVSCVAEEAPPLPGSGSMKGEGGDPGAVFSPSSPSDSMLMMSRQQAQVQCFLRFPAIPFVPKSTYNVLTTDYDNYAIVSGAKNKSFVQVYSRTPTPGDDFLQERRAQLVEFGYKEEQIRETPQDCVELEMETLNKMMDSNAMRDALGNVLPGKLPSEKPQTELEAILDSTKKNKSISLPPFLENLRRNFLGL